MPMAMCVWLDRAQNKDARFCGRGKMFFLVGENLRSPAQNTSKKVVQSSTAERSPGVSAVPHGFSLYTPP